MKMGNSVPACPAVPLYLLFCPGTGDTRPVDVFVEYLKNITEHAINNKIIQKKEQAELCHRVKGRVQLLSY